MARADVDLIGVTCLCRLHDRLGPDHPVETVQNVRSDSLDPIPTRNDKSAVKNDRSGREQTVLPALLHIYLDIVALNMPKASCPGKDSRHVGEFSFSRDLIHIFPEMLKSPIPRLGEFPPTWGKRKLRYHLKYESIRLLFTRHFIS
jgi:hypothetical protein